MMSKTTSMVRNSNSFCTEYALISSPVEDIVEELNVERGESEASPSHDDTPSPQQVKLRTKLYEATKELYAHLCVEHREQTWHTLLDGYRNAFNAWKACYSTGKTLFLDRAHVNVPAVRHIISAANLVILMDSIQAIQATGNKGEALRLFRVVDEDFPRCIMAPESATANSYDEHQTFDRALEIRISLWILQIGAKKAVTEKAAMKLGSMLLFGISNSTIYPHQIESETIEFRPIYGVEFDGHEEEDDDLRKMRGDIFREFKRVSAFMANGDVDLKGLQEAFPIDACLDELFKWAKNLFGEVERTIERESARPTSSAQEAMTGPREYVVLSLSIHK